MREELQEAIERAFIDLHYAEAELKMQRCGGGELPAAIEHVKLAIRELQAAIDPPKQSDPPQSLGS